MQTLICPHWAPCHVGQQDDVFMLALAPPVLKIFFSGQSIPRLDVALKAATKFVLLRHHGISENGDNRGIRDRQHALELARAHADKWMQLIPLNIDRAKIAVEGLNEPHVWPWGDESPENVSAYYAELIHRMALNGIRVVAGNLGVGWPGNGEPELPPDSPPIWKPFQEMFEAIEKSNGFYGHHEYWYINGPQENWGWWAGRALTCPWDVPIIITEAGIDSGVVSPGQNFGWHGLAQNDRADIYFRQLVDYERQCVADGRVVAITPFTEDFYDRKWATFSTRTEEFHNLWLAHAREVEMYGHTVVERWKFPQWASDPWTPDKPVPTPTPTPTPSGKWDAVVAQWDDLVRKYSAQYQVSREVVHTLIVLESAGKPDAINATTGCVGLMQIMPLEGRPTAAELADPETNIAWGCRLLAGYIDKYGSIDSALCAYGGVKNPTDLACASAQAYLNAFALRWSEVWPGKQLPFTMPKTRTVPQQALIDARWYAEEAVRKIEAGVPDQARAILLKSVIEQLYELAGDRE